MANMNRYTEALFDLLRTEREICTHSKNQPPKALLQQAERQREHLADLARAIDEGEAMSDLPRTDEERAYFFGKKVAEALNFGDRKRADHWMEKFGELREGYGPPGDARRIRINAPYYAAYSKYRKPLTMYRCPKCHDADNLLVNVLTSARLIQSHDEDENFETDVVGDHEWDNQSTMWCTCGFSEAASAFDEDNVPEADDVS